MGICPLPAKKRQKRKISRIFLCTLPFSCPKRGKAALYNVQKRDILYKSRNNKMICGVCAGIADYFNIDPSIVRVLWAVLALAAGTGVLAYIACAIILPEGDTEV
mgnify:CR=1 FL=1